MRSSKKQITEIEIILSEREARWLMAIVQNPIGGQNPLDEPIEEGALRHALFESLQKHLQ